MTTSWTRLLHGDLPGAFEAHAFGPILYALYTVTALAALAFYVRGFRINTYNARFSRALEIFALVFIGYGVVRMAVVTDYRTPRERAIVGVENAISATDPENPSR